MNPNKAKWTVLQLKVWGLDVLEALNGADTLFFNNQVLKAHKLPEMGQICKAKGVEVVAFVTVLGFRA